MGHSYLKFVGRGAKPQKAMGFDPPSLPLGGEYSIIQPINNIDSVGVA